MKQLIVIHTGAWNFRKTKSRVVVERSQSKHRLQCLGPCGTHFSLWDEVDRCREMKNHQGNSSSDWKNTVETKLYVAGKTTSGHWGACLWEQREIDETNNFMRRLDVLRKNLVYELLDQSITRNFGDRWVCEYGILVQPNCNQAN